MNLKLNRGCDIKFHGEILNHEYTNSIPEHFVVSCVLAVHFAQEIREILSMRIKSD